jgi:hypothetical protein
MKGKFIILSPRQCTGGFPAIQIEIKGVEVFDPTTGDVRTSGAEDIACWFIDTTQGLPRRRLPLIRRNPPRQPQITFASTWRRLVVNGRTSEGHLPASTAWAQASLARTSGDSSS